jgi:hypothetical protein
MVETFLCDEMAVRPSAGPTDELAQSSRFGIAVRTGSSALDLRGDRQRNKRSTG